MATSDTLDVSTITDSSDTTSYSFDFTGENQILLENGTNYVVVVEYTGGDSSNYIRVRHDATSPTHDGNYTTYSGSWSADNAKDAYFYVYTFDQHTLSKSSGVVNCDYLDLSNSNATGGATWYAGLNSEDTLNNDGWIFGTFLVKDYTADAIINEAGAKTISADALIKDVFTSSHTADSSIILRDIASITADTIITVTDFWKVGTKNDITTTLDGGITATANSIDLVSTTGLQAPGIITVGIYNADGQLKPDEAERVSFGSIDGNTLNGCSRGVGGSTATAWVTGTDVRENWTNVHWDDFYKLFTKEHGPDGTHSKSVKSPDYSSLINLNLDEGQVFSVTLAGNPTLALMNDSVGQTFILRLIQGAGGGKTVTWWSGIKWEDNVAPTLTTTAGKTDVFSFVVVSAGNYDGFISGQNM